MVITLTGSNDFLRKIALQKIKADFVKNHGDFGLENIHSGEVELGRLLESVASLPFLAQRRMIILDDPSSNKLLGEKIEQFLDAIANTTDLIMVERKFDKRLTLYKVLKKRTDYREYLDLDEHGLARWLSMEATQRGGELNSSDAHYLIQRAGSNQMGLSNELDKLLSYEPTISKGTIDLLIEPLPQSSVFHLLDAAFAGNHKKALELYDDQRNQQVEPQAIMGMLAWQLHVIAVVKFNEKEGADIIAKEAKLNPYVVRKTLNLTRNLSQKAVKELVSRALALDVSLKTENIDADDAVQHFLLTI
ncbi:DNA polymerase III subunit delta [Candidatus Saccharibacteria bacterium]|nr:DNA polymerase III subunit delta [Candidatus Saccharibacteria bacterium]